MELASAWLLLDKHGSNIPIKGVTPAELIILIHDRKDFVGKHPVHNLKITGKSKRSDSLERQRLKEKYGGSLNDRKIAKIDVLYPGQGTRLPQTFEELGTDFTASCENFLSSPVPDIPDFEDSELAKLEQEDTTIEETVPTPAAE